MNAHDLVARVRDHYVDQFVSFVAEQRATGERGGPEVKLALSDRAKVFRRLYCADWVYTTDGGRVVEFAPEHVLTFPEFSMPIEGRAEIRFIRLRWDRVVIRHDLEQVRSDHVDAWFDRWFDPDDTHLDPAAPVTGFIHSLLISPGEVSIDFGTASVDAFWDMVKLLVAGGAKRLRCLDSDEP